jgi:hypothetical protein
MRFQVFTAASVKMTALWDIASCSLVVVDRRFDDGGSAHLRNVRILQRDYAALYPRRLSSSVVVFLVRYYIVLGIPRIIESALDKSAFEDGLLYALWNCLRTMLCKIPLIFGQYIEIISGRAAPTVIKPVADSFAHNEILSFRWI